jgi:hypothetical protein
MPTNFLNGSNFERMDEFIQSVEDPVRRRDCRQILELMQNITQEEPVMQGPA